MAIEYSSENRFPFHTEDRSVSICFDDHEGKYELNFIWDKIVERFPQLKADKFYARIQEIQNLKSDDKIKFLKDACDRLLRNIKTFLSDEPFIHELHDKWGFGLDQVIQTIYAVYGYYFYTGKRTANVIKKTIDAYKRQPVR